MAGPDRLRLRRRLLRRRQPAALAAAVPAPRPDHDAGGAAANAVLEPVGTLEREVGDDAVPRARGEPLDVVDAAQRAKVARRARDECRRRTWMRRNREGKPPPTDHDGGDPV